MARDRDAGHNRPTSGMEGAVGGRISGAASVDHPRPVPLGPSAMPPGQAALAPHNPPGAGGGLQHELIEVNDPLPDILYSHLAPPHRLRQNQHRPRRRPAEPSGQRSRRRAPQTDLTLLEEDRDWDMCNKGCCLSCVTTATRFKWVLVFLALLGICCVVTGIVLGALHMTIGSSFLTLSLMFIGLGVMLVVVVGVGWRCTPTGHEPCHLLFGLGHHSTRLAGTRYSSGRNEWYGGIMYPELRYRRPPPSYNASMQEYQQQVMMAQLEYNAAVTGNSNNGGGDDNYSLPSSPPPTYRSQVTTARHAVHITFPPNLGGDFPGSRPPSYRSHTGAVENSATRPRLPHFNIALPGTSQSATNTLDASTVHVAVHASGVETLPHTSHQMAAAVAMTGQSANTTPSGLGSTCSTLRYSHQSSLGASASLSSPGSIGSLPHHHVGSSPATPSTPGSAGSTLFRTRQVMQYLDNVLDGHSLAGLSDSSPVQSLPRPPGVSIGVQVDNGDASEHQQVIAVSSLPKHFSTDAAEGSSTTNGIATTHSVPRDTRSTSRDRDTLSARHSPPKNLPPKSKKSSSSSSAQEDAPTKYSPPKNLPPRDSPPSNSPQRNSPSRDSPPRNSPARSSPPKSLPSRNSPARHSTPSNSPPKSLYTAESQSRNSAARNSPLQGCEPSTGDLHTHL